MQNSAGSITANFTAPVNNVNRLNLGGTDLSATLGITVHASGGVGQVIRGAASQSANLQEWQNSAGGVTGKFDAFGYFTANGGYVLASSKGSFEAAFGGAFVGLAKSTSTPTSPGANLARLYFRDGTTAGTLKLVVRAGASGAETTILDNIPQ